jgi:hypothetical protein
MTWNPFRLFQQDPELELLLETMKNRPQTPPRILRLFPSKVTIKRLEISSLPETTPYPQPTSSPHSPTPRT